MRADCLCFESASTAVGPAVGPRRFHDGTGIAEIKIGNEWPTEAAFRGHNRVGFLSPDGKIVTREEVKIPAGDSVFGALADRPNFYAVTLRQLSDDLIVEAAYERDSSQDGVKLRRIAGRHHRRGEENFDKYSKYIQLGGASL